LVEVCPTCHSKLESLYDKRFYKELGVAEAHPILDDYNGNYRQIEVTPSELCSFPMRMDSTDHFQFYCPKCSHPARIEKVLVDTDRTEFCFVLYCEVCRVHGLRKVYPKQNRQLPHYIDKPVRLGYVHKG